MEFTNNASKVSVAERAVWLRQMAETNRVKQQTLNPPNNRSQSLTMSRTHPFRSNKVSIKERVRMFESMVASSVTVPVATTPFTFTEHEQHKEDPMKQSYPPPPPPQAARKDKSSSSTDSSLNVVEVISSGDTNTSTTTSLSSTSLDDPKSPKYDVHTKSSAAPIELEPEPLLGLPVTSVMKPIIRNIQCYQPNDHATEQSRACKSKTQALNWSQGNIEDVDGPPLISYHKKDYGYNENELDDDAIGHIVKIVKVVNRSPSPPPQRPLLSLPWDESDDFSDPWMSSMSILDLNRSTTDTTAQPTLQQQLHRLPTTILNPTSLRNHRSQFTSHHPRSQKSSTFVFVDDTSDNDDEEDDIQTVDNSIIFDFSHDESAVTTTSTKRPFTTSLSFDSAFSEAVVAAPLSPLQPPAISRYSTSVNGTTNDLSVVLNMNWVGVPDKVDATQLGMDKEDGTTRIDKKGLIGRIKSRTTKIPVLDMRKRTTSLLCSSKQNHPLQPDDDVVVRPRTNSLDSNNDTAGLWFTTTFDNNHDDMVNVEPSTYFPPSPLDITIFSHTLNPSDASSSKSNSKEIQFTGQRSLPIKSGSNYHDMKPLMNHLNQQTNHNESGLEGSCSFPSVTSAILGNIFAEEIAADVAAASTTNLVLPIAATSSSRMLNTAGNNSSLKSAFTTRTSSLATSTSTVPSYIGSTKSLIPSTEIPRSMQKSSPTPTTHHLPPKSDRISTTIAQLCQTNKNSKFQKKSLVQIRKDQLATNLDKNRSSARNRVSKGSWQKDSNGNFKRHFILVDDYHRQTPS